MTPRFLLVHYRMIKAHNIYHLSTLPIIHRLSIMTHILYHLNSSLSLKQGSATSSLPLCATHPIFLPHLVILCCVASYFLYRSFCTSIKEVVFLIRRHVRPMSTINAQWLHFINFLPHSATNEMTRVCYNNVVQKKGVLLQRPCYKAFCYKRMKATHNGWTISL